MISYQYTYFCDAEGCENSTVGRVMTIKLGLGHGGPKHPELPYGWIKIVDKEQKHVCPECIPHWKNNK